MSQAATQGNTSLPTAQPANATLRDLIKDSKVKIKDDAQRSRIEQAVQSLAGIALTEASLISDDVVRTIEQLIGAIDRKLSEQINAVMHNPDFQKLEGTWRGLAHLVNNTETDEKLRIKVLNISKKELAHTLKQYDGVKWDQSPLFKQLYEKHYGMPGGVPFGALVGDFAFDHSAQDVKTLEGMAKIAAAAFCPFIAGADPAVMQMESWQEVDDKADLSKIFRTDEYNPWRALRDSDDSRFLGLTMPRFLSRLPYGAKNNPSQQFNFEEKAEGHDASSYTWSNAAFAMATNITQAFKFYGWCSQIRGTESGGIVPGLPCHTFPTSDGGVDMKCPTEIALSNRRWGELSDLGFMPLCHYANTDQAVFFTAQSLQKPQKFEGAAGADATANANMSARLPYIFASSRFAHFLNRMVLDKLGKITDRNKLETELSNWIANYVCTDPAASDEVKARLPLAEAKVVVEEVPGDVGYFRARAYLKPHYQLEGVTMSLRLVSKVPGQQ